MALIFPGLFFSLLVRAQIANWTFNNTLAGTGSANVTASNATLGSAIGSGAYNGGTVYFGEGGWPSGAEDPNAYLQFSVTPTSGHSMTIASLVLSIRRSTTGSSGSGPNNWALRSSLDGFAADISYGTVSTSIIAFPVTFGAAYANLSSPVTFRLYGYNATVSSGGGLNRFVFDNISISGSSGVLPLVLGAFRATTDRDAVNLYWNVSGEGNILSMNIERSQDGDLFETVGSVQPETASSGYYQYTDHPADPAGIYFYRIQLVSTDGKIARSPVQQVAFNTSPDFRIQAFSSGSSIRFRVTAAETGDYVFSLYDLRGTAFAVRRLTLSAGTQVSDLGYEAVRPGIYILRATHAGQQRVSKLVIP
jgi:hypothetical protein